VVAFPADGEPLPAAEPGDGLAGEDPVDDGTLPPQKTNMSEDIAQRIQDMRVGQRLLSRKICQFLKLRR